MMVETIVGAEPRNDEGYSWLSLRKSLLLFSIAVTCGAGLTAAMAWSLLRAGAIDVHYRAMARKAWGGSNAEQAAFYLQRLIANDRVPEPDDLFLYARALHASGDYQLSLGALRKLAPEDRRGLPAAHRILALHIANVKTDRSVEKGASNDGRFRSLKHHLEACGDTTSPEILAAWTTYYLAVGQPDEAVMRLQSAARVEPSLWLACGRLRRQLGDEREALESFANAARYLGSASKDAPGNEQVRGLLAGTLVEQGELQRAIEVLEDGLQMVESIRLLELLSDIRLLAFDRSSAEGAEFQPKFETLYSILGQNPNCAGAYQRLEQLYQQAQTSEQRASLETTLNSVLSSGKSMHLAHFSLGNFYAMQGDEEQAIWHFEQAYRLNSSLPLALNNLAWLLANQAEPDLERAEMLARKAAQQLPKESRCRDTLGFVLLKQEKYNEAIEQLEVALSLAPDAKEVHVKLADAYRALGRDKLAASHLERAE